MSVRLGTFTPPDHGSWADYLRTTLIAQMLAVGRYDSTSPLQIQGTVIENHSGEGLAIGLAALAALRNYTAMYPALADKLFADPDFRAAVQSSSVIELSATVL